MKIRKNDQVAVIAGKNKGKTGKVLRVYPRSNEVIVEKVNVVTKHVRPRQGNPGQIIHFEAPIHVSNVMAICPQTKKPTRVGYRVDADGLKVRISKRSGAAITAESTS